MQSLFAILDLIYALLAAGALAVMGWTVHVREARLAMGGVIVLVILRWGLTIATGKLSMVERLLALIILMMFLASALPRFDQWADQRTGEVGQQPPATTASLSNDTTH